MARYIDAEKYPCKTCGISYCHENCKKFYEWLNGCDYDVENVITELQYMKENFEKDCSYWKEHSWRDNTVYNEADLNDRQADCYSDEIEIVRKGGVE